MIRIPVAYLSLPRFQGNPQIGDLIDVYHPITVGPRVEGESIRVKTVVLFFFEKHSTSNGCKFRDEVNIWSAGQTELKQQR